MIPLSKGSRLPYQRRLTTDQVARFLNSMKYGSKYHVFFGIMVATGNRVNETRYININDFSEDFRILRIRVGKTYNIHEKVIPEALAKEIKLYIRRNKRKFVNGYIFYGNMHEVLTKGAIMKFLSMKREKLGINDFVDYSSGHVLHLLTTHAFRSYYATQIYTMTKDVKLVQNLLGHLNISSTSRYIRIAEKSENENQLTEKLFQQVMLNKNLLF